MRGSHIMVRKFDPAETLEIIQREKVTRSYIISTMVNALMALPNFTDYDVAPVSERCSLAAHCILQA
jgi:long-chain acyl-CoA synthetase